jgi:hypothetical protein
MTAPVPSPVSPGEQSPRGGPAVDKRSWNVLLALADLGVLVHVLGGGYLAYSSALHWVRAGHPAIPLADISVVLWVIMVGYFVATLGLLISWLASLQRAEHLPQVEKWAWAIGMCFVPLVGIAYHVRYFRATLRKETP